MSNKYKLFQTDDNPDKWYRNFHIERKKRTLELTKDIKGDVLDVGGGEGFISKELVSLERKVYIIDIIPSLLEKAQGSGLIPIKADIKHEIPFEDERFSCILLTEILEHIFDTDKLIMEVKRVLKPNGILILSVPNVSSLCSRITMLKGSLPNWIDNYGPHIRAYNYYSIINQLKKHGFTIEQVKTNIIFIPKIRLLIKWNFNWLQNLGESIVVKARK